MTELPLVDSSFAVLVFSLGDDLIGCLNKAMAFLIAIASLCFPKQQSNLRTSSNPRNQATIQDGRVTVQQVQGRQGQSYSSTGYKGNATSSGGIMQADKQGLLNVITVKRFLKAKHFQLWSDVYLRGTSSELYNDMENHKDIIKSMREKSKEENVNYDYGEIETKNVELENSVAKLSSENERLCNEINHVKQVFKEQFDSIKKTRVHTKEQSDSLIDKLNLKSAENEDLKAQIHDKLDLEPLAPRLLQNREIHIEYLKYTQEQANILRGIIEQAKAKQPLDKDAKKDDVTPKNKVKKVRIEVSTIGLKWKPTSITIVGIKRLLNDLRVTAVKLLVTAAKHKLLMMLVYKLLLLVFRVNAAGTKLQLLKDYNC
ncbi:hypothetical protein Tco_0513707 [Tanacetum coccineum]